MKIAVIGLGSMGKRRVRDLRALGHDVVGYDLQRARNVEASQRFGIATYESFDEIISAGAEAIVISTPPDQHVSYYEKCYRARLPFFSEANILTPRASWFAFGFSWKAEKSSVPFRRRGSVLEFHLQGSSPYERWHTSFQHESP